MFFLTLQFLKRNRRRVLLRRVLLCHGLTLGMLLPSKFLLKHGLGFITAQLGFSAEGYELFRLYFDGAVATMVAVAVLVGYYIINLNGSSSRSDGSSGGYGGRDSDHQSSGSYTAATKPRDIPKGAVGEVRRVLTATTVYQVRDREGKCGCDTAGGECVCMRMSSCLQSEGHNKPPH